MLRYAAEFGLTPSARSRFSIQQAPKRNKFEGLIGGSEQTDDDEDSIHQIWATLFGQMVVASGRDPQTLADAMLRVGGLMLAQHGGLAAARLAMLSGLDFLAQHEPPSREPGGELH